MLTFVVEDSREITGHRVLIFLFYPQKTPLQGSRRKLQQLWLEFLALRCRQLGWNSGWGWKMSCIWSHWDWKD